MKEIKCAFCKGKGIDPFELLSSISTCSVCGGKGKVNVEEPYIRCAFCRRTGVYPNSRLNCTVCSGKGVVTFRDPKMTCPDCKGSGREHVTTLPCIRCGGIGVIKKEEGISQGQSERRSSLKNTAQMTEVNTSNSIKVEEPEGFLKQAGQILKGVCASAKKAEKLAEKPDDP
jgi:DnaJ-class molecular chaperone